MTKKEHMKLELSELLLKRAGSSDKNTIRQLNKKIFLLIEKIDGNFTYYNVRVTRNIHGYYTTLGGLKADTKEGIKQLIKKSQTK